MGQYHDHWDWVRLSIGQTASTSADAWADLRDAEDTYWADDGAGEGASRFADPATWRDRPFVRNLERWLVQVDEPGSVAHRTDADVHEAVFEEENGIAYEGLSTDAAAGDTGFAFDVDPRFADASAGSRLVLKVTFRDTGSGDFAVETAAGTSASVVRQGDGTERTATISLPEGALAGSYRIRIALADGADDLVVRFVRLVRLG
jgi:hypothetical protein